MSVTTMRPARAVRALLGAAAAAALLLATVLPATGATAPSLGTAGSFAVLGGTTVTNTGPTSITGDLGVSPGSAITGDADITLSGATHVADAVALQAQSDVTTAFDALGAAPCTESFSGTAVELGGQTLTPGVYCYDSTVQLTGTLTLNGNGVFIFKIASTLTTATGSSVSLIGGASACNVFWRIGDSATLGASTEFVGNVLALTSIALQSGASLSGRALARNAAVTLDTNTITNGASCAAVPAPTATASASGVPTAAPTAAGATRRPAFSPPPTDATAPPSQGGSQAWIVLLVIVGLGAVALGVTPWNARSRPR